MSAGSSATPALPSGVRPVTEPRSDPDPPAGEGGEGGEAREAERVPFHPHPEWAEAFPWLVQGTTGAGPADEPFDLGLFRDAPVGVVMWRWRLLRESLGMPRALHAHQVHGADILEQHDGPPGLGVSHGYDGHTTGRAGNLLTVSVADCVPIFMVDPARRRVAMLHGGWRGTAAGMVAAGLERLGSDPAAVHVHLGPAICGECYEVGPEVHAALGLPEPDTNSPVDVRAVQARHAVDRGVPPEQVTVSGHCTRCGEGFFSHRGGSGARQLGVLGIRAT